MGKRVLLLTLPPFSGGVPAKTRILADELVRRGHGVTVAWYAPLSSHRHLSPSLAALAMGRRPGLEEGRCFDRTHRSVAVGCPLPELEFTYYLSSARWRELTRAHDRHIAVGGTALISYPLLAEGIPHFVWCASDMLGDRFSRRRAMPWPRRLLDTRLVGPVQAAMERRILAGDGRIVTVGGYAQAMFRSLGMRRPMGYMPIPTDPSLFCPPAETAPAGVVGFAGRAGDPRKNLPLLLAAMNLARRSEPSLRLRLTGSPDAQVAAQVGRAGASGWVEWAGNLARDRLPGFYQSLDVFVIPSEQEGFGIVGIEAMACGVPVVSTRCGGPEDYVVDGRNGYLTGHDPGGLAERILALATDRALRARISAEARATALEGYGPGAFGAALDANWSAVWRDAP